jgi:HEAT repeat protein
MTQTSAPDMDAEIRGAAIQALVQIGAKAVPDLIVALKEQSHQAQTKVVQAHLLVLNG